MPTSPTGASALTHSFWMGNLWAPTSGQLPPSFHFGTAVGGGALESAFAFTYTAGSACVCDSRCF